MLINFQAKNIEKVILPKSMSLEVFITVIICITVCVCITFLFRFYGIFRFPIATVIIILINSFFPFIMVIGLIPYDVSLTLFGASPIYKRSLYLALVTFYWISNIFSFLIAPIAVSTMGYSKTISIKHRIKMAILDHLVFYGVIVIVVILGLVLLLISGTFSFSSIPYLIVALTNAYGLLLFCLLMGHGLVSFPLTVWKQASPKRRYNFYLQRMANEQKVLKRAVSNGRRVLEICFKARDQTAGELHELYDTQGRPRESRLTRLTFELPHNFEEDFRHKGIERMTKVDWPNATLRNMEDFFVLMDHVSDSIDQANKFIVYSGQQATDSLHDLCNQHEGFYSTKIKIITIRILAVLTGIMSLIVLWGELIRMIKPEWSVFHLLSHISLSPSVGMLFVTTPALAFQTFIGCWSLTWIHVGSFFRFIEGATNLRTFTFWTSFSAKLMPTIGYHYLTQIGADKSQYVVVMGVMDRIPFVGREVVKYAPVLLLIIVFFVLLNLWDKILKFLGLKNWTFENSEFNSEDLKKGEQMLKDIDPEVKEILESNNELCIEVFDKEENLEPLAIQ